LPTHSTPPTTTNANFGVGEVQRNVGCAGHVALAVDDATNVVPDHGAVRINHTVNVLINVKEHFVLEVFDVL
jgi:hypothetical protein